MVQLSKDQIKAAASGQWVGIFQQHAPEALSPDGNHASHRPCPLCGGKDRFRCHNDFEQTGGVICGQTDCPLHKTGDGLGALKHLRGWTFAEALKAVAEYLGIRPAKKEARPNSPLAVYEQAIADDGTLARYLKSRGLKPEVPPRLKLQPAGKYYEDRKYVGSYPVMLAPVAHGPEGKLAGIHRTYLGPLGQGKAAVQEPRKLSKAAKPGAYKGAAIWLAKPETVLAVAEGIETALAVMQATNTPAAACISAAWMANIELPETVQTVELWADNDPAGTKAAEAAAGSLYSQGRTVFVLIPPEEGDDWLDVLNRDGPEALRSARENAEPFSIPAEEVERRKALEESLETEAVDDPHRLARLFFAKHPNVVRYQGEWWAYVDKRYIPLGDEEFRAMLLAVIRAWFEEVYPWECQRAAEEDRPKPKIRKITSVMVNAATEVIAADTLVPVAVEPNSWLTEPKEVVT